MSAVNGVTGAQNTDPTSTPPPATSSNVDKNTFLKLLVAQLQHQDPLQPQDGSQFLAQLAQFQQLETSINSGQDLTGIRSDLDLLVQAQTSTGGSSNV